MAFEEKKYLDINGVGVIRTYIDQQDALKIDTTTYEEDINKAETGLKAQVAANTANIAANAAAISTEASTARAAEEQLGKDIVAAKEAVIGTAADTADSATVAGAKKYADAAVAVEKQRAEAAEGVNAKAAADALAEAQAKIASVAAGDGISVSMSDKDATVSLKLSTALDNKLTIDSTGLYYTAPDAVVYGIEKNSNLQYQLTADGKPVDGAIIDIPKDLVVQTGYVEDDKLVLVLNNGTDDSEPTKVEINVGDLIEYVTGAATDEITTVVAVEDGEHKVKASINSGSIKVGKLDTDLQASVAKANSALQASDIVEGTGNGTIKVGGTDVKVAGLKSAAYEEASAFDAAGSAQAAYNAIVPLTVAEVKGVFDFSSIN